MLNLLNGSSNDLLKAIKEEQISRILKNKEQIKNYFLKSIKKNSESELKCEYEKEILFMIKNSVSLKYIMDYFKVPVNYVKKIAEKNKCQSQLLSTFTENENARCFSKSQILRACEDFNYICPMCFKSLNITNFSTLTGHHIQPFARGGKTIKDNCLPLHIKCHFEDFKLLHSTLFNSENPIYSAKYFNLLKEKLKKERSGLDYIGPHT